VRSESDTCERGGEVEERWRRGGDTLPTLPTLRTRRAARARVRLEPSAQPEWRWWDPKGGELCLARTKPEETLVEVRSRSDVQIDGRSWV